MDNETKVTETKETTRETKVVKQDVPEPEHHTTVIETTHTEG
jgi:ribosome-associated protein YbcJ (S4-like RNA binding protein)